MKANNRLKNDCFESCLLYFLKLFILIIFELFGGPPNKSLHVISNILQGVVQLRSVINLILVQTQRMKVVLKYFG